MAHFEPPRCEYCNGRMGHSTGHVTCLQKEVERLQGELAEEIKIAAAERESKFDAWQLANELQQRVDALEDELRKEATFCAASGDGDRARHLWKIIHAALEPATEEQEDE